MRVVVITKEGFLTTKDPKDVRSDDLQIFEGTEEECTNIIHGKGPTIKK